MKWSWKVFAIHFVLMALATIAIAVVTSKVIDVLRGPGAPDSTLVSMAIAGFVVSVFFAGLSGWKLWNFKMVLVLSVLISGLLSCNPAVAVPALPLVVLGYFIARKIRQMVSYKILEPSISDESENRQTPR